MDETLVDLFGQWLKAFAVAQGAMSEDFAHEAVAELEMRIAATPAEGLRGLAVKLGLHEFLSDHGDATSLQCDSAYSDLVRLTGTDPLKDIALQEVLRGTAGDLPLFVMALPNASRSALLTATSSRPKRLTV